MATTGYSGTPLLKKLGLKPEMKVLLLNEPANYFTLLQTDITNQLTGGNVTPDFIHLFAADNKAFENGMKKILVHSKKILLSLSGYRGIKKVQELLPTSMKI